MNQRVKQYGFTMIELMLSMAFISVLLLTIALTVIQMSTIYNQGMTIKEVNQAARDMSDEFRRTIQGAVEFNVGSGTDQYITTATSGRLCTGTVSYLWNYAKAVEDAVDKGVNKDSIAYISDSTGKNGEVINFVKIQDPGEKYCLKNSSGGLVNRNILYAERNNATDLLKAGDHTIRLISFSITSNNSSYDASTKQRLYTVTYRLGTGKLEAMDAAATQCLPPSDPKSNPQYCNVQQFTVVLRAGNTVKLNQ